jgi:hypothetical protein
MSHRLQFTTAICCPGCGSVGDATWEENSNPSPTGLHRSFLGVSLGFRHELQQQNPSVDPRLICERCDSVLPD